MHTLRRFLFYLHLKFYLISVTNSFHTLNSFFPLDKKIAIFHFKFGHKLMSAIATIQKMEEKDGMREKKELFLLIREKSVEWLRKGAVTLFEWKMITKMTILI